MSKKATSTKVQTSEPNSSLVASSRSAVKMLSRGQIDENTVLTIYKEGYTLLTVKSVFNGKEDLATLFYGVLQQQLTNYEESVVKYNGNQSANVVPQISEGGTTLC